MFDYVFRVLAIEYLNRTDLAHVKPSELGEHDPGEKELRSNMGESGSASHGHKTGGGRGDTKAPPLPAAMGMGGTAAVGMGGTAATGKGGTAAVAKAPESRDVIQPPGGVVGSVRAETQAAGAPPAAALENAGAESTSGTRSIAKPGEPHREKGNGKGAATVPGNGSPARTSVAPPRGGNGGYVPPLEERIRSLQKSAEFFEQTLWSDQLAEFMGDAPTCTTCGQFTIRSGACYRCLFCGESQGCS